MCGAKMPDIETVSQLIKELQRLMDLHGDVIVESFFEGCNGGMNVHYEPEQPEKRREMVTDYYTGIKYLQFQEDRVPATIYIGEKWYE